MNIEKIDKYTTRLKQVFLFMFCIELMIRLIGIYSLLPSKIDTLIFTLISLLGIIILIFDFFVLKNISIKENILLFAFIIALIISMIYNGPDGLLANAKLILWQILYLFAVFQIGKNLKMRSSVLFLEKLLTIVWGGFCVVSIMLFFIRFAYIAPLDKFYNGLRVGFVENRLYGMFADPNFAGIISVVVILISIHFIIDNKISYTIKILYALSFFVQFIYIILSGSRTAFIALSISMFFLSFFTVFNRQKKATNLLSSFIACAISITVVSFLVLGDWGIKNYFPKIEINSNFVFSKVDKVAMKSQSEKKKNMLSRSDVDNKDDVSNNRFELWKSSFEIFESTPLVGTSPRNFLPYAQEHLPNTFIATKQQTSHNFIFYLLATTGLLGTIPILLFIILKVFESVKILFTIHSNEYERFLLDTNIALAVLISALFLTELVLVNKIGAFVFWLYLGKVTGFIDDFKEKSDFTNEAIE
ncbi:hypothetical protein IGI39_002245 [Enterococcus sp. AZ135]|uniref:O-antigen ligase family protein n=1 Tax=unclassified Enterococcus TaxID=2608891 RepID=UPI003F24F51D